MRRLLLWAVLSLFISNTLESRVHEYYFSVTEIEFNETESRFEIVMNMFSDNLALALDREFSIKSEIGTIDEIQNIEDFIFRYILDNFAMQAHGKKLELELIGIDANLNQTTIFLQTETLEPRPQYVKFFNQLLIKEYSDQSNVMHLLSNGVGMTGTTSESERYIEIELIRN